MEDYAGLPKRLDAVRERLAEAAAGCGRDARSIILVAVSKRHGAEAVALAARHWGSGLPGGDTPVFSENYVQEALAKRDAVAALAPELKIDWHFTGALQSNKAKYIMGRFALIHTVDSLSLAQSLHKAWRRHCDSMVQAGGGQALAEPGPQEILLQVNIGEEAQKAGAAPDAAAALLEGTLKLPGLKVRGLMCLPPYFAEAEKSRPFFIRLRQIRDELEKTRGVELPHLSMGMSHDFEVAVQEGATMIRVGTDIFGPRE